MKLLLDEMYGPRLASAFRDARIDAVAAAEVGLSGMPDHDIFATASILQRSVLTENVADFVRIAADHVTAGGHHAGVIVALSSRFSRRPAGLQPIVKAVSRLASDELEDRVIYLEAHDSAGQTPADATRA